jgi:GT2 family glycosyltransferase
LSIIIPVVGNPSSLDDTLVSVLENRPNNSEIIVVHNRPYDDPYNLADEVRFIEVRRRAGFVECLNEGVAASQSPIVQVLACGVEVCPDWADNALPEFSDPGIAAVGVAVVTRDESPKIVSIGWGYRSEGTAWRPGQGHLLAEAFGRVSNLCGPDTLATFYRKSALEAVGGFAKGVGDTLVGLDVAIALRQAGFQCTLSSTSMAYQDEDAKNDSAFQFGRHVERLFWRWASAKGLATSLIGHFAVLTGQCVVGIVRPKMLLQLAGRFFGTVEAVFAKPRPKPAEPVRPSIVAPPHFHMPAAKQEQQRSSRVA